MPADCPAKEIMQSHLNQPNVLVLNAHWQAIEWKTPIEAIKSLCCENGQEAASFVLDVVTTEDGRRVPCGRYTWDEWIKLPVEASHVPILTKSGAIRCPRVVLSTNYGKMAMVEPTLCFASLWKRDHGTCQYSGRKLCREEANIDHVIPRDRGGVDSWENMVICDIRINTEKGNKLNEECGLKLIRKPFKPKKVPVCFNMTESRHPDHVPFITTN